MENLKKMISNSKNKSTSKAIADNYRLMSNSSFLMRSGVVLWMLLVLLFTNDVKANSAIYSWNMQGSTNNTESLFPQIRSILSNSNGSPDVFCLQETGNIPGLFEAQNGARAGGFNAIYASNQHTIGGFDIHNLAIATTGANESFYTGRYLDTGEQRNGLAIFVRGEILNVRIVDLPGQTRPALLIRANVCGNISWYATLHLNSGNAQNPSQQGIVEAAVGAILAAAGGAGNMNPVNIVGDFNLDLSTNAPPNPNFGQYVTVNGPTRPSSGTMLDFMFTTNIGPQQQGVTLTNNGLSDHLIVCYGNLTAGGERPNDDSGDNTRGDVAFITRTFASSADASTFYNDGNIYYTGKTTFIPLFLNSFSVEYLVMEADASFDVNTVKEEIESERVGAFKITLYADINFRGRSVNISAPSTETIKVYDRTLEALGFASTGPQATSSIRSNAGVHAEFYDDTAPRNFFSDEYLFTSSTGRRNGIPDLTDFDLCENRERLNQCPVIINDINDRISSLNIRRTESIFVPENGVVALGATLDLADRLTVDPNYEPNSTLSWFSGNEALATVDASGLVSANATIPGETVIYAVINPGNIIIASYQLFVAQAQFDTNSGTINTGESLDLGNRLAVEPADVRQELIWTSADTTLATVDENGVVTANTTMGGTTNITAAIEYAGLEATFQLNIQNPNRKIDFDFDDDNNPLPHGILLSKQYTDFNVRTSNNRRWAMLFNTANPTSNDFDIGTPNEAYGGSGIGAGGVSNRTAQGNALVVSKNLPAPNETEGSLIFNFNKTVTINSIDLLDMKCGDSHIDLYNEQNELITNIEIPAYGVNSFSNFSVNTSGVRQMIINLDCGGGLTGFSYTVEDNFSTSIGANGNCDPAEILYNIVGDDYTILGFNNPGTTTISYSEKEATNFKSIESQFGINYIDDLNPCTNYAIKTSVICENGAIKESPLQNFRTDCSGSNKDALPEVSSDFHLFPNPVSDVLSIQYKPSVKQIIIYDTMGKAIESIEANESGTSTINVQQYAPGIYMMVSANNEETFSQKFIVK